MTIYFGVSFIIILVAAMGLQYWFIWIHAASSIPAVSIGVLGLLPSIIQTALHSALYGSLIASLSYSVRHGIRKYPAMLLLFMLAVLFAGAVSFGASLLKFPDQPAAAGKTLGQRGLLLALPDRTVILPEEPDNPLGPQVVSLPNQPLEYTRENPIASMQSPFRSANSVFLNSLVADCAHAAEQLRLRLVGGLRSFALYLGSLCLLLVSLRFVFELSLWPLMNLFFGMLAFRLILRLEIVLDSGAIQTFLQPSIRSQINSYIPAALLSPAILCAISILFLICYLFFSILRNRRERNRRERYA